MEAITLFEKELKAAGRKNIDILLKSLSENGYYQSRCCGHDCDKGGTVRHSLWVLTVARQLVNRNVAKYGQISDDSLVMMCLLHDICNAYPGRGHGRKSAKIIDTLGLDVSVLELAAIRFHCGFHPQGDELDNRLCPYAKSAYVDLLKKADHIAASVFNNVPPGTIESPELTWKDIDNSLYKFASYSPKTKHWYFDTKGMEYYPIRGGKISAADLQRQEVKTIWGINLYHISAYDVLVCRDSYGRMAVFTAVVVNMNSGDLYRSDRGGFSCKSVIMYYCRYKCLETSHYVLMENMRGEWRAIRLNQYGRSEDDEFITRTKVLEEDSKYSSEADLLTAICRMRHGVNLRDAEYFERIDVAH